MVRSSWQRLCAGLCVCLLVAGPAAARKPVGKLVTFEGYVEVSSDGVTWRVADRARNLFPGYLVRTGKDARAQIVETLGADERARDVGAFTTVEVTRDGVRLVPGTLSEPASSGGLFGFLSALERKFSRDQRYTTVRRNLVDATKVQTARDVVLAADYPELAWQNAGAAYRYRLVIGGRAIDVPAAAADQDFVSFTVPVQAAGSHPYRIEVLSADGSRVFADDNEGTLTWLAAEQAGPLVAQHRALLADRGRDDLDIVEFLMENGLVVQAMLHARAYVADNPDDVYMSQQLAKAYALLELDALQKREADRFQVIVRDEG
jgi:hypothetical protein